MPARPSRAKLRADLQVSCVEGAAYGGMVGLGETYLPAFALAVGLGELVAGLVGSLPLLAGGIMQMASPVAIRMLGSHKRWVVLCATIQALAFAPLVLAAYLQHVSSVGLLAIATAYWGAGMAAGPAWNTWIGDVVPPSARPRFFALRTRASQLFVFVGFLTGGICLQTATSHNQLMATFVALFVAAAACRCISASLLSLQSEPTPIPAKMRQIRWSELLPHFQRRSGGRLVIYLIVVQAAVQTAGPYFTPFMLAKLQFSYGQLATLISTAYIAKVIALPMWGRVASRIGARRLLWIGGVGITPLSAGWLVSGEVSWLILLQIVSGVAWAAYELAFFLLFFESIPSEERTSLLTLYNLFNGMAWVGGALLGGSILHATDMAHAGYLAVFAASAVFRCGSLLLLARVPALDVEADEISIRTIAVRPDSASLDVPILPSLPDQLEPVADASR